MAYRDSDVLERKDTMGTTRCPSYFVKVYPEQALTYLRKPRDNPFSQEGIASLEKSLGVVKNMAILYSPRLEEMREPPTSAPAIPFALVPQDLEEYTQARPDVARNLLRVLEGIADRNDRLSSRTIDLITLTYLQDFLRFLNGQQHL